MNVFPSELNECLSGWLRKRVAADNSLIKGKAYFWRSIGVGLMMFGLGAAVGLSFFGYSVVIRNTDNHKELSDAFSSALANAHLKGTAEGTVQIEPHEIVLASGQTISLDGNSRVALEPTAKVLAEGNIRISSPPQIPTRQASAQHGFAPQTPITDFTVFKSVPFEKGTVMTGWKFATSADKSPTSEYCYYTIDGTTPDVGVILELGDNGIPTAHNKAPKNFDIAAAFDKCVWFGSVGQ